MNTGLLFTNLRPFFQNSFPKTIFVLFSTQNFNISRNMLRKFYLKNLRKKKLWKFHLVLTLQWQNESWYKEIALQIWNTYEWASKLPLKTHNILVMQKIFETTSWNLSRSMLILAIRSWTRSLQSTANLVTCNGTHKHTSSQHPNIQTESTLRANTVKVVLKYF